MVYLKYVENIIPLSKLIGLLFLFCLPLLSILFLKTKRNDLARPVMGTIFLVYSTRKYFYFKGSGDQEVGICVMIMKQKYVSLTGSSIFIKIVNVFESLHIRYARCKSRSSRVRI